jgi:hypothetical protein
MLPMVERQIFVAGANRIPNLFYNDENEFCIPQIDLLETHLFPVLKVPKT